MPAVAGVYCAHTRVHWPAQQNRLPELELVSSALYGHLCFPQPLGHLLFSAPHLAFPAKAALKVDIAGKLMEDVSLGCLCEWRRQERTDDVISEAVFLSQEWR